MADSVAPVEAQVQPEPLSDLPAAQPYGQERAASEPVVTQPPPHEQSPPPTPAPVFDSRRNRYIDPATNKIVRDPTKPPVEQAAVSDEPPVASTVEAAAPVPTIQHTPLTLNLARQYGIPEHIISATPTADLRAEISLLQGQSAAQARKPVTPPVEEPIDWGINPETKLPFKESDFDEYPLHKQMVRSQHQTKLELAAQKRELEQIKQENIQRSNQSVMDRFHALCDSRPDIFGTRDAVPGTLEAISRDMMRNQLAALSQSQHRTTLEKDFDRMVVAFGRQQAAQPTTDPIPAALQGRMTREQWERSGLAQTAHRNTTPLPKTRRQVIAERYDDEARRNGIKVPAGGPSSDLSDLPPR